MEQIKVEVIYDKEEMVYVATSNDISGLVAEASTFDLLREKLFYLIPELIQMNGYSKSNPEQSVPVDLLIQERASLAM